MEDGKELEYLLGQRVQSGLFTFTLPANNVQCIDIAGGDGTTNAVSDGYWIMLVPPSVGEHTIQIYGKWKGGTLEDPLVFETDAFGATVEEACVRRDYETLEWRDFKISSLGAIAWLAWF